jgi:Arc/MetJ-type ribon-helix-helix transcriptional regulator
VTSRYDSGMTMKIAVSLPDELVLQAKAAVKAGQAESVSAYVAAAMAEKSQRTSLRAVLDALDSELGAPAAAAVAWAEEQLDS